MSLKNLEAHNLLARHFVCAWRNTEGDPDAGESNRHPCGSASMELRRGIGKANVQTLVLTPDGKIIHAISGYVGARDLLWELEQALHTWNKLHRVAQMDDARRLVKARMNEIDADEAKERALVERNKTLDGNPDGRHQSGSLLNSWTRSIVEGDRNFVREHALMPIEDFKTRMLTGGRAGRFGYSVSKSRDLDRRPGSITRAEFQKLPSSLRKSFKKHLPDAFHGDPTMLSLSSLPKALRKSIEKRVKRMRRIEARKAAKRN